jgi:hypothetical protein
MELILSDFAQQFERDEGNAEAEYNFSLVLEEGRGIEMNKSPAARDYALVSDQSDALAQVNDVFFA